MNIEQLIKDNEKKLYARAFILMRKNKDDAYDLLQMSLEKVFKSSSSLEDPSKFYLGHIQLCVILISIIIDLKKIHQINCQ